MQNSKEVHFYYVPKEGNNKDKEDKILINFRLNSLSLRKDYSLAGMFIPGIGFREPDQGYLEFSESGIERISKDKPNDFKVRGINGFFTKFSINPKSQNLENHSKKSWTVL